VVAAYRQAIADAEAEADRTGHSALSAPGLALPEPAAPEPTTARLREARLEGTHLVLAWSSSQPRTLRLALEVLDGGGGVLESRLLGLELGTGEGERLLPWPVPGPPAARVTLALVGPGASPEALSLALPRSS
jgi:hypothetical protein